MRMSVSLPHEAPVTRLPAGQSSQGFDGLLTASRLVLPRLALPRLALSRLALSSAIATLAVTLQPALALAQDMDDESVAGGSILGFYWNALGPVWTIVFLALSFWLVALVVMCFLQIRKSVLIPPGLTTAFEQHLEAKQYQEAYELAKGDDSPMGQVLAAGMGKLQSGYPAAVEAMQEAQADEAMKLEHKISYVSLVGALTPMFGLLGTVAGMVSAFMVIAQRDTAPKPNELAIGISQALVTTQIGLVLAIPAIACFALFRNWLQRLNADVEEEGTRLMSRFQGMGKK
jgi:biopolymer transport protein ExbB